LPGFGVMVYTFVCFATEFIVRLTGSGDCIVETLAVVVIAADAEAGAGVGEGSPEGVAMLVGTVWAGVVSGGVPAFVLVQPAVDAARIRSIQNPPINKKSARFPSMVFNKFLIRQ
jgi:hypothetical protein